jgi:hypothetical protein
MVQRFLFQIRQRRVIRIPARAHHLVQRMLEAAAVQVLQQETAGTGVQRPSFRSGCFFEGERQGTRGGLVFADPGDGRIAVHHRHMQVHDGDGDLCARPYSADVFLAVRGVQRYLEPGQAVDQIAQRVPEQGLVIHLGDVDGGDRAGHGELVELV